MAEKLSLEVVTPFRTVLNEDVDSVTLPGSEGEMGILPEHVPLLTTLDAGIMSYVNGKGKTQAIAVHWAMPRLTETMSECWQSLLKPLMKLTCRVHRRQKKTLRNSFNRKSLLLQIGKMRKADKKYMRINYSVQLCVRQWQYSNKISSYS